MPELNRGIMGVQPSRTTSIIVQWDHPLNHKSSFKAMTAWFIVEQALSISSVVIAMFGKYSFTAMSQVSHICWSGTFNLAEQSLEARKKLRAVKWHCAELVGWGTLLFILQQKLRSNCPAKIDSALAQWFDRDRWVREICCNFQPISTQKGHLMRHWCV